MGTCLSTKKEKKEEEELSASPSSSSPPTNVKKLQQKTVSVEDEGKKHVFIITHGTKPTRPSQPQTELAPVALEKKPEAVPAKTTRREEEGERMVPVRMSNCTKEEVESILIQCGRISRSPSGMGSCGSGGGGRRSSGSKRSYDFDAEKEEGEEEEEWEGKVGLSSGRPSPRRRASSRERDGGERKRSKSRERGGGGRRVSRSPVRKSEGGLSSSKSRQPEKMVSIPATEKGKNTGGAARRNPPAHHPLRSSSPRHRSRSPATLRASSNNEDPHPHLPQHPPQSPYRRNPMAEIDTNVSQSKSDRTRKAASPSQARPTNSNRGVLHRDQHLICRAKDPQQQQQPPPPPPETAVPKSSGAEGTLRRSSSRRFSRDLDAPLDTHPAPNSYTSILLEDIQNYHHQNTGFSLPACVTKACSILDAVADLTGSETCGSSNDLKKKEEGATGGNKDKFVETELGVDDDLMEPSIQKYVSSSVGLNLRIEKLGLQRADAAVPEESTGSNSYVGQARLSSSTNNNTTTTTSTQETHNSVDSSDVCWTSSSWSNSNTCEEEEEQPPQKKMMIPPHKTCEEEEEQQPPQKKMMNPPQKTWSACGGELASSRGVVRKQRTSSAPPPPPPTTGSRPHHPHRRQSNLR